MSIWVGTSTDGAGSSGQLTVSSLPLPPATQVGDYLILMGMASTSFSVSDGRMTRLMNTPTPGDGGESSIWVGTATTLAPISLYAAGTSTQFINHYSLALGAFRASGKTGHASASAYSASGAAPIVNNTSRGAMFVLSRYGAVLGALNGVSGFVGRGRSGGYRDWIDVLSWDGPGDSTPASTLTFSGTDPRWHAVTIGLIPTATVAPPARLFPRSDDLGHGSGRTFPAPISQQRSTRRHGYY